MSESVSSDTHRPIVFEAGGVGFAAAWKALNGSLLGGGPSGVAGEEGE